MDDPDEQSHPHLVQHSTEQLPVPLVCRWDSEDEVEFGDHFLHEETVQTPSGLQD